MPCQQIECSLKISSPAIYSILHDYLKLRKFRTRWVPHQLTHDQKRLRVQFCRESLKRFEEGRSRRVFDIITGDESWFYHYDPETKEQSKMWVPKEGHRPMKVRRNRSSGKRMVAIFFMKSGLIESIPLESGASVNADWYVNNCLSQVFDVVSQRRDKTGLRGLILRDDNARPHRAWTTNEFLAQNRVESYRNPPYSPHLSPCDFFLFGRLKSQLRGIRFNDDNDMLMALASTIGGLTKAGFQSCFSDWFSRMYKRIDAGGIF
jgi:[histone H3]-lysine36 N-dimethyltransferase SETMAR